MTNPSRNTTNKRPSTNDPEATKTDHQPQRKRLRILNSGCEELGSVATTTSTPQPEQSAPGGCDPWPCTTDRDDHDDRSPIAVDPDVPTSDTPASRGNLKEEPRVHSVVESYRSPGVDSGGDKFLGRTMPNSTDPRTGPGSKRDTDSDAENDWEVPRYHPFTNMMSALRGEGTVSPIGRESALIGKEVKRGGEKNKNSNILRLDWVWSSEDISSACMHVLSEIGDRVFFHQDYSCGTAAARGTQPMTEGQHFWEIKMDSPVYGTAMMLGIGTKQVDLYKYRHTFCNMLGSDSSFDSCGLSYTGRFYQGSSQGRTYCNKFGQGTVIGLHLDMWLGTLTFYKNSECLGIATKGLRGKVWYPMISSTAAKSSMCLQNACSFPSSLQFWCCRALRQAIPTEHNVLDVLEFPPGMQTFLQDNLLWLLDSQSRGDVDVTTKGTQTNLSMATHQLSNVPVITNPVSGSSSLDS